MRTEKTAANATANSFVDIDEHLDFIETFQDFRREERTALTKFIEAYEALPCLWDKKDYAFSSKFAKQQAYKQLAAISNKMNPNVNSVEWVKNKITGLRAVFFRDYKKVVDSIKAGSEIYIPKLWYFGLMLFITESDGQNIALNDKIRRLLNLKADGHLSTACTDLEISGLVTEADRTEHREAILEFIKVYKAHPCLWKFKKNMNHDLRNKEMRSIAHQELIKVAQPHFPGADLEWVKLKICKLRAVFMREHRKKERAIANGVNHVPSLWYYEQMLFVLESDNRNDGKIVKTTAEVLNGEDPLNEWCQKEEVEEPLKYNYADEGCMDDFDLAQAALDSADPDWNLVDSASDITSTKMSMSELLLNTDSSQSVEQLPTSSSANISKAGRKRKKNTMEDQQQPVMIHLPELPTAPFGDLDELNGFSSSMAAKLRRMSQEQRDLAELEIGRILFLGLRGRLVDSTILPPVVQQSYPDCSL